MNSNGAQGNNAPSAENTYAATAELLESDIPTLQDLQQQVLNTSTTRIRTLIMYAVAAAVLLGLAKKIIIPPFNTLIEIETGQFVLLALIILAAASYLVWELWSGVRDSIGSWLLNRDLAYQNFRHTCLNGISELEARVSAKLQRRIEFTESRIRANLSEERNGIQTRLGSIRIERQGLSERLDEIDQQVTRYQQLRQRETSESGRASGYSPSNERNISVQSADETDGPRMNTKDRLLLEHAQVKEKLTGLEVEEQDLAEKRDVVDSQLNAGEEIAEQARDACIQELDLLFTDSVSELVKEWRHQQQGNSGTARRYSLMLGVERKNNDFLKLQSDETMIIRNKGHWPKWMSTIILGASLLVPFWTLGQQVHCETQTDRADCPESSDFRLKEAIEKISEDMTTTVDQVIEASTAINQQRTTVLSTLVGTSRQQAAAPIFLPSVPQKSGQSGTIYAGSSSAGLLRLSFPVFPRNSDSVLETESSWLSASATSLVEALESCGTDSWLHVVGYADSALFRSEYKNCTELPEGGSIDMQRSRNLCLANRRAHLVAEIFRNAGESSSSTPRITARQWQGVRCETEDCYSEYDMMLHEAGIRDVDEENAGVLNRRVDVHIMSAGNCSLQSVVNRL